jgi:hypothetical protein
MISIASDPKDRDKDWDRDGDRDKDRIGEDRDRIGTG